MCPYEIQVRYNYISDELDNVCDTIQELYKDIEQYKVDEEVAELLFDYDYERAREDLLVANNRRKKAMEQLKFLEEKYEKLQDLFDQVYLGILENAE